MLRSFIFLLSLTLCLALHAQTAAQTALNNEPEIRQIQRQAENYQEQQSLPNSDIAKPGPGAALLQGFVGLKAQQILLDRLQERLEKQAEACHFCAAKQDELSELLRQQLAIRHTYQGFYHSREATADVQKLFGFTPTPERWASRNYALEEARNVIEQYCNGSAPNSVSKSGGCEDKTAGGPFALAAVHERTWAACFRQHEWVEDSSKRLAYESCMAKDPWVKYCPAEGAASRPAGACSPVVVTAADVDYLHYYNDRWITDPKRLPASAHTVLQDPIHLSLLEPVTAPPIPPPSPGSLPNAQFKVRARLDTPIEAVTHDIPGRVVVIPVGTEISLQVNLYADGPRPTGARISLSLTTFSYKDEKQNRVTSTTVLGNYLQRSFSGWPLVTGSVLIPANSPLTFETACECPFLMSVADFRDRVQNNPNQNLARSDLNHAYATRPILQGSRIQTVLLEPIDVSGIQAGKPFHAQLNVDMELPRNSTRADALKLPRGTDVYLKVTDKNSGSQFSGHTAELAVDYVLVNGEKVPLTTPGWTHTFTDQVLRLPHARRTPEDTVLWPAGDTKWFDIADQVEVSQQTVTGGTELQQLQTKAAAQNAADKTALHIYAGSQMSLILLDVIDLASINANKLFHAQLSADMQLQSPFRHPDTLLLPSGTDVYLKVVQKSSGSPTHIPVEISADHVFYKGAEISLETSAITRMVALAQTSSQPQRTRSRRTFSVPRIGNVSIPANLPQGAGPSNASVSPVVLAAQSAVALTVSKEAVVPGALSTASRVRDDR